MLKIWKTQLYSVLQRLQKPGFICSRDKIYLVIFLPAQAIPLLWGSNREEYWKTTTIPIARKATVTAQRNNIKRFNRARAVNKIPYARSTIDCPNNAPTFAHGNWKQYTAIRPKTCNAIQERAKKNWAKMWDAPQNKRKSEYRIKMKNELWKYSMKKRDALSTCA